MNTMQRGAWALCTGLCLASVAVADVVTVHEVPTPAFDDIFGVSNLAADGTVIGWTGPPFRVARWRPGQPAEDLGGDTYQLSNVTPLVSKDGEVIAATIIGPDAAGQHREWPSVWRGGTQWLPIGGLTLDNANVNGISDDGTHLVGVGSAFMQMSSKPWIWSAQTGQVVLPGLPGKLRTEAWGVSNDGRIAIGYADDALQDRSRHGVMWTAGAIEPLLDAEQQPLGHAIACNADCSIVVGGGFLGAGGVGSTMAWRRSAQGGVAYLGEVPGAQPDLPYYAMDTNEDGTLIVGTYAQLETENGFSFLVERGFVWTPADGIVDLMVWFAMHGIDYGADFDEIAVVSMTRDGRRFLINGLDAEYRPRRAVVRIDPDAIYAHGFEAD